MHYNKIITATDMPKSLNLNTKAFAHNKYAYYKWLRENDPIHSGKAFGLLKAYFPSRYEDCVFILKDPRFVRNRTTATGGGKRSPIPLPKSIRILMKSMINMDDPEHRRLRNLVHKAFSRRNIAQLAGRIEKLTHELLDKAAKKGQVEFKHEFARPIPVTVIAEMMGVELKDMPQFAQWIDALSTGLSGLRIIPIMLWTLPKAITFVRGLIAKKRQKPADDILSALIQAEEEGDKLSEDELVAMVFLIIVAGYETTYNLMTNAVFTLLQYPEQLALLKAQPELMDTTIEEVMRFNGPIHSTKPEFPIEDIELHGTIIPKGATIMPLLGAANHDPSIFPNPERFDITRKPNKHLGFGMGMHFCLGAQLARMETKIALQILFDRFPDFRLAVPANQIELGVRPGWHDYKQLPIVL